MTLLFEDSWLEELLARLQTDYGKRKFVFIVRDSVVAVSDVRLDGDQIIVQLEEL